MQREGSPWQGLGVVTLKELSDHLTSWRMLVLEWLVGITAVVSVYVTIQQVGEVTAEDPYLLLRFFTRGTPLPFVALLSFLVPLMSIGLGFDLVNSEHNQRTLSRVLSQPIYRDALLFGKFLAGLATISISLLALWLLLIGLGLVMLGIPPGGEEVARAFIFLLVTIAYAGVWLALALLLSIVFRSAATAALSALGLWLFLTILWPLMMPLVANILTPSGDVLALLDTQQVLARISPSSLFNEVVAVILDPSLRSTQQSMFAQMGLMLLERGAIPGAPIPLLESVMVVWGQIVGLVAGTILLFVIGYVVFQRQEVRA
ncbi:MAG TPA: ABC transporter permease [Xanthobacteraceae bacterium]|jgi:ABC-2 type transport system permease protein|nr:ABC transporter permease [Xanthobacteraceae bacterium]